MRNGKTFTNFIKAMAFLLIFCLLVSSLSSVLRKKSPEMLSWYYHDTQKDSHDVIFLGPSTVMNGIYPMRLWEEHGVTAYNLGSGNQTIMASLYLAKEAVRHDHPRVIVLDCATARTSEAIRKVSYLHFVTDNLPALSANRMQLIRRIGNLMDYSADDMIGLVCPLYLYHGRWDSVDKEFFERPIVEAKRYTLGAKVAVNYKNDVEPFEPVLPDPESELPENVVTGITELQLLCEENGAELVLVNLPIMGVATYVPQDNYERRVNAAAALSRFAEEHNIRYLDMLNRGAEIGIEEDLDTTDGQHLNRTGAEKFTDWIGAYLVKEFDLADHRNDPAYTEMSNLYNEYQSYVQTLGEMHVNGS